MSQVPSWSGFTYTVRVYVAALQIQGHALYIANWFASHQLGFLTNVMFSLYIYFIDL